MPDDWSFLAVGSGRRVVARVACRHDVWAGHGVGDMLDVTESAARRVTVAGLPCDYRGDLVEIRRRRRGCLSCGEPVYRCDVYGLAAVRSAGADVVGVCLGCQDRKIGG